ncbi:hypothetical protein [Bifidobacterium sp. LCP19S3_H1]
MLDASRNLNISSKLPFARLVETFSNNLSTSRLEREILRLWYAARAIGVGRSRRNRYGNEWYESKHVETSEVYPVSLPAAGDATEFAVWSGELSIARMPVKDELMMRFDARLQTRLTVPLPDAVYGSGVGPTVVSPQMRGIRQKA